MSENENYITGNYNEQDFVFVLFLLPVSLGVKRWLMKGIKEGK